MQISYSYKLAIFGSFTVILIAILSLTVNASELSKISINQLKLMLDNPEVAVIDVRGSKDWQSSGLKIKGAIRGSPKNFDSWVHDFSKDKMLILY
ncbi:MAG: hypothetical protein KJN68_05065 [Bacteroidia bacterium]|nr:hypothetical protein [Bacteroidia bacterium]